MFYFPDIGAPNQDEALSYFMFIRLFLLLGCHYLEFMTFLNLVSPIDISLET